MHLLEVTTHVLLLDLNLGCGKSFSLVVKMKTDGTVMGQWVDKFNDDTVGIHMFIDCMTVDGNTEIIGVIVTKGSTNGANLAGSYAVTAMVDNGTSANDPLNQISNSYYRVDPNKFFDFAIEDFGLLDMNIGQH